MKTFRDWEIYGNDEQKMASQQNKTDLKNRIIDFLMNENKTFTCNYCQNTYNWHYLESINEYPQEKTLLQRETWENELVRLKSQQVNANNPQIEQQLISQIILFCNNFAF